MSDFGLLIIDLQEKLIPHVERPCEVVSTSQKIVQGFVILNLPMVVSLQSPEKLGSLVKGIASYLPEETPFLSKTSFSCLGDPKLKDVLLCDSVSHWVVVGVEAHVCVLQTVKDLLAFGKTPIVLNDAISSRSIFDYSTAIGEMKDLGVRVTSLETLLFELIRDAKSPHFKAISELIK